MKENKIGPATSDFMNTLRFETQIFKDIIKRTLRNRKQDERNCPFLSIYLLSVVLTLGPALSHLEEEAIKNEWKTKEVRKARRKGLGCRVLECHIHHGKCQPAGELEALLRKQDF